MRLLLFIVTIVNLATAIARENQNWIFTSTPIHWYHDIWKSTKADFKSHLQAKIECQEKLRPVQQVLTKEGLKLKSVKCENVHPYLGSTDSIYGGVIVPTVEFEGDLNTACTALQSVTGMNCPDKL